MHVCCVFCFFTLKCRAIFNAEYKKSMQAQNENLKPLKSVFVPLTLLGCVPFVFAAFAPYFGIFTLPIIGDVKNAVVLYSLAIVSFMSGVQWGVSLTQPAQGSGSPDPISPTGLMLASNLMVLTPWLILASLGPCILFYFTLAVTFILLMLVDYRFANRNIVSHDYCKVRIIATAIVVFSLIMLAFSV